MADFKGSLSGTGHCTRLGSLASGLTAEAGSYGGKVVVKLWRDTRTGKDRASVRLEPGPDGGTSQHIWEGNLDGSA